MDTAVACAVACVVPYTITGTFACTEMPRAHSVSSQSATIKYVKCVYVCTYMLTCSTKAFPKTYVPFSLSTSVNLQSESVNG